MHHALRLFLQCGFCLALLLLVFGCAARVTPPSSSGGSLPAAVADSLFLSPIFSGPGGNFTMPHPLEKSQEDPEGCLLVWQSFLVEECRRQGQTLVLARQQDSLAVAQFNVSSENDTWQTLYGCVPGAGSRIIHVQTLRLEAMRRGAFARFLSALNLSDDSRREYGWLELSFTVHAVATGGSSGVRRLVSREPDTPWVSSSVDRAGRLMMRGAKDLARELVRGTGR